MGGFKDPGYLERKSAATDARKAALEKFRANNAANDPAAAAVPTAEQKRDLAITGMTCASCVVSVETALRSVPGVASADVHLATERAMTEHVERDPADRRWDGGEVYDLKSRVESRRDVAPKVIQPIELENAT